MKWLCLISHDWQGCRCHRCGLTRNASHNWNYCRCRDCNLIRRDAHLWEGCICGICRAERHHWSDGICTRCGMICDHLAAENRLDSQDTLNSAAKKKCHRCGQFFNPDPKTATSAPPREGI